MPAVRQKFHLSPCAEFRDRLYHPVVLQRTEAPSGGGELGFDVEGVEAFLPLTPKCALYMPCISTSDQIIAAYENALRLHRQFRSAAMTGAIAGGPTSPLLQLSQRVVRQSHALYQALTTGVALTVVPENVENLNYLQCAWAHAAIYSNRRDFTFAKRVLEQTPQYRKTPKALTVAWKGNSRARRIDRV